jgi:hypothetical protein
VVVWLVLFAADFLENKGKVNKKDFQFLIDAVCLTAVIYLLVAIAIGEFMGAK